MVPIWMRQSQRGVGRCWCVGVGSVITQRSAAARSCLGCCLLALGPSRGRRRYQRGRHGDGCLLAARARL